MQELARGRCHGLWLSLAFLSFDELLERETLMVAHLLDLAIMRSTDNFARENILVKATSKLEHQGVQPTRQAVLEKVQKDPELSAALDAINKRELECSAALEKAFRDRVAIPLPGACASR